MKCEIFVLFFLNICGGIFGACVKTSTRQECNFTAVFDPAINLDTISLRIPTKQGREGEFVCPDAQTNFYPADPFCTGFYYTCVNGYPYLQECPGTSGVTAFDPATNTCRPIESAFCYFTCPKPDGFFAVPATCASDYYVCVGGQSTNATCPLGAVFDPVRLLCVSTEDVSCKKPFTCPSSDGVFPYPEVCSTFYYNCTGGQSSIQYCPGDTIFDPQTLTCVLNENAPCSPGGTPTPTTTEYPSSTTPEGSFTCPSSGPFPYPGNCSYYYICTAVGAEPIEVPCPSGLVYNPVTTFCDKPENVPGCAVTDLYEVVGENVRDEFPSSYKKDYLIICPTDDGLFPHKFESSHYYACVDGNPYSKVCPGLTVFDPVKSYCVTTG